MASSKKEIGRIKLPAAFAELGMLIDPTKMKPDAWLNRNKSLSKKPKPMTPSLTESKTLEEVEVRAEISNTININKPSIGKGARRKRSHKKHLLTKQQQARAQQEQQEEETSDDTEETMDGNDNITIELQHRIDQNELTISTQLHEIELLKHEKLILQEWRTEIGESAIANVQNLEFQLQIAQNTAQEYQLEIEGLQTQNHAFTQQIQAYQDEIEKLETEKPKLQSQIAQCEQMLSEQYMLNERLQRKDEELSTIKIEYESLKISSENNRFELKTQRKENQDMQRENGQYLQILDSLKQQESKLKNQVSDQALDILQLTTKNQEIYDKLKRETVETRQQLQVATHFANGLSDQLEEIQNFQSSPRAPPCNAAESGDKTHSKCNSIDIGYGRPLFEKRKTLKILSYEQSLKLPNMSDMIDMIANEHANDATDCEIDDHEGDEFIDLNTSYKLPQPQLPFTVKVNSKTLPPITQVNEFEYDEKDKFVFHDDSKNSSSSTLTFDESVMSVDTNHNHSRKLPVFANEEAASASRAEYVLAKNVSELEQDEIDKLLRKIAGSSYYKFRNEYAVNGPTSMDAETRYQLKLEIVRYIDAMKTQQNKCAEEKDGVIVKYKLLSKEWEQKYKSLKREIKKRKLKSQQSKQKTAEPVIGGCKFWSWGLNPRWFVDVNEKAYVADDSDDTEVTD